MFRICAKNYRTKKTNWKKFRRNLPPNLKILPHKILKKNSEEFTAANQKNMGEVLNPLKEKIHLFEKKVEDTYQKGLKDQTDLRAELKNYTT